MSLFYASKCHHPICHQLNVAAMCRSKEYGAPVSPQEPGSWVENVDQQEMLDAFEGSGDDLIAILKHITKPSRWALHTVYPPLETYVKDRIVLVGDAVSPFLQL